MELKTAGLILAVTQVLSPTLGAPHRFAFVQKTITPLAPGAPPNCRTIETGEITITCTYIASPSAGSENRTVPRIILNRAEIAMIPSDGNPMRVSLTFTNGTASKITEKRAVYLSIDDDKGNNHMRRILPHVDFSRLEPGKLMKFDETLLAPAFSPGPYVVSIWIPSSDDSLKFDPTHNLLLSSKGVPDPVTGLNQIAKFVVTAPRDERSGDRQTNPH
jgi:hypothetical protein